MATFVPLECLFPYSPAKMPKQKPKKPQKPQKPQKAQKSPVLGTPGIQTGAASSSTGVVSSRMTPAQRKNIAARLEKTLSIDHPAIHEAHYRPINEYTCDLRPIAVFRAPEQIPLDEIGRVSAVKAALAEVEQAAKDAMSEHFSLRFANLGDPEQRVWYADEVSGRTIQEIYNGWTSRFDQQINRIHQERLDIATEVDMDGDHDTLKEIEKIVANAQRLKACELEIKQLRADLDVYETHPYGAFLSQNKHMSATERLQGTVNTLRDERNYWEWRATTAREQSFKYMVDHRLRTLLQHWGVTSGKRQWQKYDTGNFAAMRLEADIDKFLANISHRDGNAMMECQQPIGLKHLMRVASIHRIIHGADLLADCHIIADKRVRSRHDQQHDPTVGLMPEDLRAGFNEKFSDFPSGVTKRSLEKRSGEEASWQDLFDKTVYQLYGLENVVQAKHIVACLTGLDPDPGPDRLEVRPKLQSHADFINKWVTINEMVHHYASRAERNSPATWPLWKDEWLKLRKVMTEQNFGLHQWPQDFDAKPWPKRIKRALFQDYVRLFAQVCQLYNLPTDLQTAKAWRRELRRLDRQRWEVYRYAIQTWNHGDIHGGRAGDYDAAGRNPNAKAGNLWAEFNWIYGVDQWKFAQRHDPEQPPDAPKLWDDLTPLTASENFDPIGIKSERWHGGLKDRDPPYWPKMEIQSENEKEKEKEKERQTETERERQREREEREREEREEREREEEEREREKEEREKEKEKEREKEKEKEKEKEEEDNRMDVDADNPGGFDWWW
ncbi:hypothetical protein B0T21DRAFT_415741 [Apiosordaria backusii]|uniref:Uncharacterized protein n=1 Tax=Apiosordaria backusii TaxID=314023 RepID=A0AA40AAQ6_9PEZI|nr:hypothetical protein B0T21DRAFT_415741 [Apiosordaria backusii]